MSVLHLQQLEPRPDTDFCKMMRKGSSALLVAINRERKGISEYTGLPVRAYRRWRVPDDKLLKKLWSRGLSQSEIASHMGRPVGSVSTRLDRLDLRSQRGCEVSDEA